MSASFFDQCVKLVLLGEFFRRFVLLRKWPLFVSIELVEKTRLPEIDEFFRKKSGPNCDYEKTRGLGQIAIMKKLEEIFRRVFS